MIGTTGLAHSKVIWVYLYAYSEKQIRDMFIEYDIVAIREVEEL